MRARVARFRVPIALFAIALTAALEAASSQGGALPGPLPPFPRDTSMQILMAHVYEPVTPLHELRRDVPDDLE